MDCPMMFSIFLLLAQIVCGASAANDTTMTPAASTSQEDLTRYSQGPEACPEFIPWPQVPAPISCDDPDCRGMSWATPPYRCRQTDGVMFGKSILGCPCCPRIIACEDLSCEGNSETEICESELLAGCVCVASRRRVPAPPTSPPEGDVSVEQVEEEVADLSIHNAMERNTQGATSNRRTCPSDPPIKCIDPQCRNLDDGRSATPTMPRCNQIDGKLVIEGTEVPLHGCQCCPEYIFCPTSNCMGDARQVCTSALLRGCFCDWPGRGPHITPWQRTPFVLSNDIDEYFDNPDAEYYNDGYGLHPPADPNAPRAPVYDPPGGELGYTVVGPDTVTFSLSSNPRPLATAPPALTSNLTWIPAQSIWQRLHTMLPCGDVSSMSDGHKSS